MFVDHASTQFQGVGYLTLLHREMMWQQREPLYLLIMGEALLQDVDAFHHHGVDLLVLAQLNPVGELYATRVGPFLKCAILRHHKG